MADVEVIEDNTELVAKEMESAIAQALTAIGLSAERYAKAECPVDTGRLRNSITNVVDAVGKAVYIGTNVEYGPYVELGTSRRKPHPFLKPAATQHVDEYRAIIERCMKG